MKCDNCQQDPCRGPREPSNKGRFKVGQRVVSTAEARRFLSTIHFSRVPMRVLEVEETTYCGTTGQHVRTAREGWTDAHWLEEAYNNHRGRP